VIAHWRVAFAPLTVPEVCAEQYEATPAHLAALHECSTKLYDTLKLSHTVDSVPDYRVIPRGASGREQFASPTFPATVKVCLLQTSCSSLLQIDNLLLTECAKGRKAGTLRSVLCGARQCSLPLRQCDPLCPSCSSALWCRGW
jgi:hypothetical protein